MTYIKVSPRGFANEYTIFAVSHEEMPEFEAEYGNLEDENEGGHTHKYNNPEQWVKNAAIKWADRHW